MELHQEDNGCLAYWLTNTVTLLFLMQACAHADVLAEYGGLNTDLGPAAHAAQRLGWGLTHEAHAACYNVMYCYEIMRLVLAAYAP